MLAAVEGHAAPEWSALWILFSTIGEICRVAVCAGDWAWQWVDVEQSAAGAGDGVLVCKRDGEVAAVGPSGDVLELHESCDVVGGVGALASEELVGGGEALAWAVCFDLLVECREYRCSAARCKIDWSGLGDC